MISESEPQQLDQVSQRPNKKLWLFVIIGLIIAGGAYYVLQNQQETADMFSEVEILSQFESKWKEIQAEIPFRPSVGQSVDQNGIWGYTAVQFMGNNALLIAFEDGHTGHNAVLNFTGENFTLEEIFQNQGPFTENKWQELINVYGNPNYPIGSYTRDVVREGEIVVFPGLTKVSENIFINYLAKDELDTSNWQIYRNEEFGFEVKYPDNLMIEDNGVEVRVTHSVSYTHNDPCEFKGDAHVLNEVVDFNATIKIFNQDIESVVKATYQFPGDIVENGQFKLSQGFVDSYSVGDLSGYRLRIGAEGCGVNTYYFPLDVSNTLVVTQEFSPERTPLIFDYETFLNLPGIISPEEEEKLFDQILSTFRFIE